MIQQVLDGRSPGRRLALLAGQLGGVTPHQVVQAIAAGRGLLHEVAVHQFVENVGRVPQREIGEGCHHRGVEVVSGRQAE